ncbi:hypothetical protein DKX38_027543 [Salix brachista]|uniref:Uncharacterized protein n=1 Tax=Salix brachista TaxID=2182728 RepID=A0A5N5JF84_9ROSI|nr:hypothetical protein DKX38_027543 [Salix brachista]
MAPRKKAEETKTTSSEKPATRRSARMTRSTAKRLNAKLTELQAESGKKRMQEKAAESKKKKVKTEVKEAAAAKTTSSSEAQEEGNTEEVKEEEPEADVDEGEATEEDAEEESPTGDAVTKTIVIEHCKQCNAFKTRAIQVQDGLLSAFPGISVLLNPEKVNFFFSALLMDTPTSYTEGNGLMQLLLLLSELPFVGEKADLWLFAPRRGCFEIREEGGETFISLQSMKRPFPPLKALDMDKVISDIIDRVKRSTNASG